MNFNRTHIRVSTNALKYKDTKSIIPLCIADMDFLSPLNLRVKLQERLNKSISGYTYISDEFYDSIVNWMKTKHSWQINHEDILYSQSILSSITSALQCLTEIDDDILLLSPEYHAFYYLIERNKRNVIEYPLKEKDGQYSIDFSELENFLTNKTKAIIISSPHNPIGKVWKYKELKELGEFCIRNSLIIFSDEIHADLVYQPNKHIPIASVSEEISNITLTFNSPTKTFNLVGLSLSYIIGTNKNYLEKVEKQLTINLYNKVNFFNDFTLVNAYKEHCWLLKLKQYLIENIFTLKNLLEKNNSKIKFKIPEATYLVWLDFRDISTNNKEIEERLTKNSKVRLLNGFDFTSKGGGFFRLNIATSRKNLVNAVNQIINEFK